ncbi:hypothetical protein TREMEDRAFT_59887 [Tremella mesenterica DSM 1558]|uniref:uncharacterized protein n=1 Tax=Tremella mesenterica (strain ATCC 24925 / CBS 8224 / DSM 1558 / NBRC 9311 / NRRL Y-6157 / RJB 2259-6 / UBC 559-6) TaxID=578456 RepID=UPI0003F49123|nr:uncharacterized protein TREMEDRAFT_59887 [Tremella mesenterica DSM 1558]EIW73714.1 hypothetical protein TREMEDRAFT_59887 [Tremella mesenterica DSM 1558]
MLFLISYDDDSPAGSVKGLRPLRSGTSLAGNDRFRAALELSVSSGVPNRHATSMCLRVSNCMCCKPPYSSSGRVRWMWLVTLVHRCPLQNVHESTTSKFRELPASPFKSGAVSTALLAGGIWRCSTSDVTFSSTLDGGTCVSSALVKRQCVAPDGSSGYIGRPLVYSKKCGIQSKIRVREGKGRLLSGSRVPIDGFLKSQSISSLLGRFMIAGLLPGHDTISPKSICYVIN